MVKSDLTCLGVNFVLILDVFILFYNFDVVVMLKINIFFLNYFNIISNKKQSIHASQYKTYSAQRNFLSRI
jgi:hypothetical protein